ncbi:hypothetical protein L195_g027733, partial [Trifolium pratense]
MQDPHHNHGDNIHNNGNVNGQEEGVEVLPTIQVAWTRSEDDNGLDEDDNDEPLVDNWTEAEKALFEHGLMQEGPDWERISMFHVVTRSAADCQFYFYFLR